MERISQKELSAFVLNAAFAVHFGFGPGLLEACYEGAFAVELSHRGIGFERQVVYPVTYAGEYIGAYIADVVVANTIIRSAGMRQSRECQGRQNAPNLSLLRHIIK